MIDINEGNKIIAAFDGGYVEKERPNFIETWTHKDLSHILWEGFYSENLEYHSSWDWLMPVVEKIESLYDEFHGYFGVHISSNTCTIQGTKLNTTPESFHPAYLSDPNAVLGTKIESTWYNIVQFIKWYNNHVSCTNDTIG